MRHPINRDRFRQFLIRETLPRLILYYISATMVIACVIAFVWWLPNANTQGAAPAILVHGSWEIFLRLYGTGTLFDLSQQWGQGAVDTLASVLASLMPSILLGGIVYKMVISDKRLIVFRDNLELISQNGNDFLVVTFYIATRLPMYDFQATAFAKTYERRKEVGQAGDYPMKNVALAVEWGRLFAPYPFTPSTFLIPVSVERPNSTANTDSQIVLSRGPEGDCELISVGGIPIAADEGDFCQIFVIVQAPVPSASSELIEVRRYELPRDIAYRPLPALRTSFDRDRDRFTVENWQDF